MLASWNGRAPAQASRQSARVESSTPDIPAKLEGHPAFPTPCDDADCCTQPLRDTPPLRGCCDGFVGSEHDRDCYTEQAQHAEGCDGMCDWIEDKTRNSCMEVT